MGVLTDIVAVEQIKAQQVAAEVRPASRWPTVEAKGVNEIALSSLWQILKAEKTSSKYSKKFKYLAGDQGEGPWVFLIPNELRDLIASLKQPQIHAVAAAWAETAEMKESAWWSPKEVEAYLQELCVLASNAKLKHKQLLLWTSL